MKCPKCGYLGFETVDRCRNCGYDFSLSTPSETPPELPLQQREGTGAPLGDFDLGGPEVANDAHATGLDLERLIGTDEPPAPARASEPTEERALPLFAPASNDVDDMPLITTPRPVRPPLSVRRAAPDVPRVRTRAPRPRRDNADLDLRLDTTSEEAAEVSTVERRVDSKTSSATAGRVARVVAMCVDLLLLGGIDATVIYLTLAIAGLTLGEARILPIVPLVAFLLLLNGGYLVGFTTASGQTIGKMLTGIRVIADDGTRVDVGRAVLRATGCLLSLLTAGLGYLPAIFSSDARALQDRIAGTRVVRVQ